MNKLVDCAGQNISLVKSVKSVVMKNLEYYVQAQGKPEYQDMVFVNLLCLITILRANIQEKQSSRLFPKNYSLWDTCGSCSYRSFRR